MDTSTMCPCCEEHQFVEKNYYECCPICNWIDDLVQREDPDFAGGANDLSLNDYKEVWEKKKKLISA